MRKSFVTAGALALALALGACSNGEDDEAGSGQQEPESGQEAESAQALATEVAEQAQAAETAQFDIESVTGEQETTGEGELDFSGEEPAVRTTLDAAGEQIETRVVDQGIFLSASGQMAELVEGDEQWVDISQEEQMAQMMGEQARMGDPTQLLEQLGPIGTIAETEETELDGEPVTRHVIDIEQPQQQQPEGGGGQQQQGESAQVELLVDEENRPAQIIIASEVPAQGPEQPGGEQTMTVTYSEWGEPVEIEAPPEEEVGELNMPEQQQPQQPGGGEGPEQELDPEQLEELEELEEQEQE